MKYEDTQPYRLGRLYKQLGEALMSPKTDMRDLAHDWESDSRSK